MKVFTIADLHLSLDADKPMDVFPGWENYVERIRENWNRLISEEDTVVLAGDISWGMSMEQALLDFRFLQALPGSKLIIKGNHDYWFSTASKMSRFFEENGLKSLKIIHNNCAEAGDIAVCGSRGWMLDSAEEQNHKVYLREVGRLEASLKEGAKTGKEPVVFLHYPPIYQNNCCAEMLEVMHKYGVRRCYYGHIHGSGAQYAFEGECDGITFRLVSADYLKFVPVLV